MTARLAAILAVLLLAGLVGLTACASRSGGAAPSAEEEERKPVVLDTVYDDARAGGDVSEEVSAEIGLVDDPALAEYVDAVGRRLARHAPGYRFDYRFHVVDQDVPNAFALPGGYIYVTRGLLALTGSEDELANVLAHEIIHVASRHAAGRQQLGRGVPGLVQWFQMGYVAAYGRDQERTSDRLGQGLAGLAGWDPRGMARFLSSLDFTDRLQTGTSRLPGFLDTHPATTQRVAEASQRAGLIAWSRKPGIATDRADYLARLDGLAVGPNAAEGVFQGSRFLHADMGFTLRFPEGWETRNTRRAVGAMAPGRDGQIFLEHQGGGKDPERAAAEWLEKNADQGLRVEGSQPLRLIGRPAWRVTGRASTGSGPLRVILTWIPHRGAIFRLTGVAVSGPSKRHEGSFLNVARSFRPMTRELRDSIRETRLRVVRARQGESLAQLSARSGNDWDVQRTAVMNGLYANQPLAAGQLVKVAVAGGYVSSAPPR